jgi:endonuclease/exonuclease/phosphatase family metal-dependent hydrolase
MPKSLFRRVSKKFFIIANIIVAVLFLIGCYGKWFFSATAWPIGFLPLSAFYLLVVLLLFFIFWLFVKPAWGFIFITTLVLSYGQVTNIIPARLSASFVMEKRVTDIRVMSWNVAQFNNLEHKNNPAVKANMIQLINEYKPDIACFQEFVAADTLVNMNTPYYRKYSFFTIYEFLEQLHFPDYYYAYNFKEDYLMNQHFGVAIFSRYPIVNKQIVQFYPYDYNSIFEYIDIKKGEDTLRVFNFHLESLKFSPGNYEYIRNPSLDSKTDVEKSKKIINKFKRGFVKRQIQADRIRAVIDKSPYPVVVCGDFNDVPNSYAYQTIGKNLQNAFVEKGVGLGRTFSGIAPTLRIDNIFVDEKYTINQFVRVAKKLSDHFPIITDIKLKED